MSNEPPGHPDKAETSLTLLLHAARPTASPLPRFRQEVWRRIGRSETSPNPAPGVWLAALLNSWLRPRLVLTTLSVLVVIGGVAGALDHSRAIRAAARAQYLAAVAPNALR